MAQEALTGCQGHFAVLDRVVLQKEGGLQVLRGLYLCPNCGRRGVAERAERSAGRFRCRYCYHYPSWTRPPVEALPRDRRTLIRQN